jgi:hypothetical protein
VDYVLENDGFISGKDIVMITLEFGFHRYRPGANTLDFVYPAPGPDCAAFLHPVLRHYRDGELIERTNLDESLYVRHDAAAYDPAEGYTRPAVSKALVMKFLNRVAEVTSEEFPLEPLYHSTGVRRFVPWDPEEARLRDHDIPKCLGDAHEVQADGRKE